MAPKKPVTKQAYKLEINDRVMIDKVVYTVLQTVMMSSAEGRNLVYVYDAVASKRPLEVRMFLFDDQDEVVLVP